MKEREDPTVEFKGNDRQPQPNPSAGVQFFGWDGPKVDPRTKRKGQRAEERTHARTRDPRASEDTNAREAPPAFSNDIG